MWSKMIITWTASYRSDKIIKVKPHLVALNILLSIESSGNNFYSEINPEIVKKKTAVTDILSKVTIYFLSIFFGFGKSWS